MVAALHGSRVEIFASAGSGLLASILLVMEVAVSTEAIVDLDSRLFVALSPQAQMIASGKNRSVDLVTTPTM